jgi:hypothetical protein
VGKERGGPGVWKGRRGTEGKWEGLWRIGKEKWEIEEVCMGGLKRGGRGERGEGTLQTVAPNLKPLNCFACVPWTVELCHHGYIVFRLTRGIKEIKTAAYLSRSSRPPILAGLILTVTGKLSFFRIKKHCVAILFSLDGRRFERCMSRRPTAKFD